MYGLGQVAAGLQQGVEEGEDRVIDKRTSELRLENLENNAAYQKSVSEIRRGLGAFVGSNGRDTGSLLEVYNKYVPGINLRDFVGNEDGSYTAIMEEGDPINFKNKVEVVRMAEGIMNPEGWLALHKQKPVSVSAGAALVNPGTGEEVYRNPNKGGSPASMFGKVKLKNGQVVSESDLRAEYAKQFQKVDELGITITDPNAPRYQQWRNTMVSGDYKRGDEQVPKRDFGMPGQDAMRQGEKEVRDEMGLKDWIPFVEPDEKDIRKRAQDIEFGAQQPASPDAGQPDSKKLPATLMQRLKKLKPGKGLRLPNGQIWTMKNGKPVRIK